MNCWGLNGWREGNTANQDLKKVYNESITCPILLRMGWEWMNEKESIKEERKEGRKEKENGGLLENKETWKGRKKRKREASVWFSHSRNSCKEVELFYCWGVYSVVVIYLDFIVIVVSHSFLFSGRSLRYQKRYMALPSPLTAIKFWRVSSSDVHVEKKITGLNCLRSSNVFAFYLLFLRFV